MKNIGLGTGFTVFVLFFGVALIDALQSRSWVRALFWFAIGVIFLLADRARDPKTT